jgi:hypothetical protein
MPENQTISNQVDFLIVQNRCIYFKIECPVITKILCDFNNDFNNDFAFFNNDFK